MTICVKLQSQQIQICTGDLNRKITVNVRSLTSPTGTGVDFNENMTVLKTVWAMIKTVGGAQVFDGTNITKTVTHNFYIRYMANVTFENWILYNNQYYDLLGVQNINEQNQYMLLQANLRGTSTLPVNYA